jgi:C-terminal processing protease CtpA/Prc
MVVRNSRILLALLLLTAVTTTPQRSCAQEPARLDTRLRSRIVELVTSALNEEYVFAERKHLNSFYVRATDSWEHFWTQEEVRGPKLVDVPIFILTSGRTFSAAEEFTYNLKSMKRATIVGETPGAGRIR